MNKIDTNKEYPATVLAYMAGIIDGEGSITITDCSEKQGRSFFTTSLGISSTDEVLIDWIIDNFGGWKGEYTPKQLPANSRKRVYRWQITGKNLEAILTLVYPHLVIKKREADIMFKMRETYHMLKPQQPITDEIVELRKKYTKELRNIHCRNYK